MELWKNFHGCSSHLGLFCWDIFSESVYILLEQESLLLDGKNTLTQNHLGKEQKINSYYPSLCSHILCTTSDPPLAKFPCILMDHEGAAWPTEPGFRRPARGIFLGTSYAQRLWQKALFIKKWIFELVLQIFPPKTRQLTRKEPSCLHGKRRKYSSVSVTQSS